MSAFDFPTSPSQPGAKSRSPSLGDPHLRPLTGSATCEPALKVHRNAGFLPPGTVALSTTPAKRRFPSNVSRDTEGKRTVGSVYARHIPKRNLLIDFAEFFRYAHTSRSKALAMAIVGSVLFGFLPMFSYPHQRHSSPPSLPSMGPRRAGGSLVLLRVCRSRAPWLHPCHHHQLQ
jgi:hypothetical protein